MEKFVVELTEEENIALSGQVVRRLTETNSGDACLLYLWLRRGGAAMDEAALREKLAWERERFETAKKTLTDAGLARLREARQAIPAESARPERMPEYSDEDVARRIEGDADFMALLRETERRIGVLSAAGAKMLLGLRDYLGLP